MYNLEGKYSAVTGGFYKENDKPTWEYTEWLESEIARLVKFIMRLKIKTHRQRGTISEIDLARIADIESLVEHTKRAICEDIAMALRAEVELFELSKEHFHLPGVSYEGALNTIDVESVVKIKEKINEYQRYLGL